MANSARFSVGAVGIEGQFGAGRSIVRSLCVFGRDHHLLTGENRIQFGLGAMTEPLTSEAQGLFTLLRQAADAETVAAIEEFVADATDRELCRINLPAFAARRHLDEER